MNAPSFDRPIFIIAAPRSGSSLLFEALSRARDLWTVGGEAHEAFEGVPGWHPRDHGYDSNRLTAAEATASRKARLTLALAITLRDSRTVPWCSVGASAQCLRLLEKTPKNALRVPLLKALFPDARFIFLVREPRGNISSIIDAWRSGRFVTYRDLPDWPGSPWSMLLPPGWRNLKGESLEQIAAFQWNAANTIALDDLSDIPSDDWCVMRYETLLASAREELARICAFIDLTVAPDVLEMMAALPVARHTLTPPRPDKWRGNEEAIQRVMPQTVAVWARLRAAAQT